MYNVLKNHASLCQIRYTHICLYANFCDNLNKIGRKLVSCISLIQLTTTCAHIQKDHILHTVTTWLRTISDLKCIDVKECQAFLGTVKVKMTADNIWWRQCVGLHRRKYVSIYSQIPGAVRLHLLFNLTVFIYRSWYGGKVQENWDPAFLIQDIE